VAVKIRAALAVLAVAAGAALSAACSVAGAQSTGTTQSAANSVPETHSSTHTSGAPITVLPPSTTMATTQTGTSSSSTGASTSDTAPLGTTLPEPTVVETTVFATTASRPAAPTGTVVVIDPGHNGGNASHPEIVNKQVPAGFGQFKACNTTGTATDAGYPEHRFNWQVAQKLRDVLHGNGITVLMTRDSDDGVGPCVNERAAVGNDANAAAVISIHGDGEAPNVTGFFVMTASRAPAGPEIAAATDALAADIRDGMTAGGFPVSSALGRNGLWARGDLGGLNLSLRPTVMIECGNMRNAAEAAAMSSPEGQQRYAEAIAAGVLTFLAR
jgi:N-acetylmuramoyl-L-alanine amidase